METENKNIHVIKVDMENRPSEDTARDAALHIAAFFDQLVESTNNERLVEPKNYSVFQERGYQGLYGGLSAKEIRTRKGLKENQPILDNMGNIELAANLFCTTQTDEKLRRNQIVGKKEVGNVHFQVGQKVRQTIKELGGTMPEDLPTTEKSENNIRLC